MLRVTKQNKKREGEKVCANVILFVCVDGWMDGWMDGCVSNSQPERRGILPTDGIYEIKSIHDIIDLWRRTKMCILVGVHSTQKQKMLIFFSFCSCIFIMLHIPPFFRARFPFWLLSVIPLRCLLCFVRVVMLGEGGWGCFVFHCLLGCLQLLCCGEGGVGGGWRQ